MHFATELTAEELCQLHEINFGTDEPAENIDVDVEHVSLRFGAGSPTPLIPRSERQYEGFLPEWV